MNASEGKENVKPRKVRFLEFRRLSDETVKADSALSEALVKLTEYKGKILSEVPAMYEKHLITRADLLTKAKLQMQGFDMNILEKQTDLAIDQMKGQILATKKNKQLGAENRMQLEKIEEDITRSEESIAKKIALLKSLL